MSTQRGSVAAMRVVSLVPSATEILFAVGSGASLVGRTHECDYPPEVANLPVCTEPKFADGTSYEIDQRVKAILQEGLSVYRVDAEVLDRMAGGQAVTNYLQPKAVAKLLAAHRRGQRDHGEVLWSLLCFDQWHRQWLEAPAQ